MAEPDLRELAAASALVGATFDHRRQGFDILDDDEGSREIIARAVACAQVHVRRSD